MIDTEILKRKILDLAIKGKLVPQDSTDEPASELLKRIKIERDRLIAEGKIKGKKDDFSYIFKGEDNCYYEKNTRDVKQFKGVLPYELPNGWCFIKIKNIASLYTGDSINQDVKKAKYTNIEKGFNYIGTKDIGYDNQINYENGVKIPFNEPFKVCPKGKILLCIEGGNAGNKIAISEENVCFGNKLLCFNTFLFEDTFLFIYLQSTIFRNVFKSKETGLIGGVSIPKIGDCYIPIPSRNEQLKIVKIVKDFLNKINSINRLFVDIENLKLKIKSRIISLGVQGKLLNTDDNYYYQKELKTIELGKALIYEQPTNYIVQSEDYNDNYKTPVLTAGKSFILGKSNETKGIFKASIEPVLIFDDFTTSHHYVDFDFKVKSSAMKILKSGDKDNYDIKFLNYLLSSISINANTHKRYWISIYSKLYVQIPNITIQRKIVRSIEEKLYNLENL